MDHLRGLDAHLQPLAPHAAGNFDAPRCDDYLPDDTKAQPRELGDDLARLEEMLRGASADGDRVLYDRALRLLVTVRAEVADMPTAVDVECGYEGRVDAEFYRSSGTVAWTCPRCGADRETDAPTSDED